MQLETNKFFIVHSKKMLPPTNANMCIYMYAAG
jgi:hypothetical protein